MNEISTRLSYFLSLPNAMQRQIAGYIVEQNGATTIGAAESTLSTLKNASAPFSNTYHIYLGHIQSYFREKGLEDDYIVYLSSPSNVPSYCGVYICFYVSGTNGNSIRISILQVKQNGELKYKAISTEGNEKHFLGKHTRIQNSNLFDGWLDDTKNPKAENSKFDYRFDNTPIHSNYPNEAPYIKGAYLGHSNGRVVWGDIILYKLPTVEDCNEDVQYLNENPKTYTIYDLPKLMEKYPSLSSELKIDRRKAESLRVAEKGELFAAYYLAVGRKAIGKMIFELNADGTVRYKRSPEKTEILSGKWQFHNNRLMIFADEEFGTYRMTYFLHKGSKRGVFGGYSQTHTDVPVGGRIIFEPIGKEYTFDEVSPDYFQYGTREFYTFLCKNERILHFLLGKRGTVEDLNVNPITDSLEHFCQNNFAIVTPFTDNKPRQYIAGVYMNYALDSDKKRIVGNPICIYPNGICKMKGENGLIFRGFAYKVGDYITLQFNKCADSDGNERDERDEFRCLTFKFANLRREEFQWLQGVGLRTSSEGFLYASKDVLLNEGLDFCEWESMSPQIIRIKLSDSDSFPDEEKEIKQSFYRQYPVLYKFLVGDIGNLIIAPAGKNQPLTKHIDWQLFFDAACGYFLKKDIKQGISMLDHVRNLGMLDFLLLEGRQIEFQNKLSNYLEEDMKGEAGALIRGTYRL